MEINKIAVILPCLNEENTIKKVIMRLRKISGIMRIKLYIIAVDDASIDKTPDIIKKFSDQAILLRKRERLASVIKIGMAEALKTHPDVIIHIDSDGQYCPEQIPSLIEPIKTGKADFVLGTRDIRRLGHMPFIKKAGNSFFSLITSIIVHKKIKDAQTGFRAMTYRAAKSIRYESSYTYTQEEIIRISRSGFRISQVDIDFIKRESGKSRLLRSPIDYGIRAFADIVKITLGRI